MNGMEAYARWDSEKEELELSRAPQKANDEELEQIAIAYLEDISRRMERKRNPIPIKSKKKTGLRSDQHKLF